MYLLNDFIGIEDLLRIENLFDLAHDRELDCGQGFLEIIALRIADAVLA